MTLRELVQSKREEILALAAQHRARDVRLFGSAARGDERADSDVDFLVEFEPGARLMDRLRMMVELEDLLGRRVDVLAERSLDPIVGEQARREAVAL
jgi:uncharacterized protein